MASKFPMSQGRRTPLSLNAQPKQQAQQSNRRPSTSAGTKAEQNRQHQQQQQQHQQLQQQQQQPQQHHQLQQQQQQHYQLQQQQQHHQQQQQQQQHHHHKNQTKDDKKEVNIDGNNTNSPAAAAVAAVAVAKEIQNVASLNKNGADTVVGNGSNGSNGVSNGNNKAAVDNANSVAHEAHNEKKETRARAVKQQQQPAKNDVQQVQVVKNVAVKNGAESVVKTATPSSPSQRKQQQQQAVETKVSPPSAIPIRKPVEEKATITKQQKLQHENQSSANALVVDESTSKQIEKASVVDNKSTVEITEPETRTPSAKDVKHVDVQSKDELQQNNVELNAKCATPTKQGAEIKTVPSPKKDVTKNEPPSPVSKYTVTSCIDVNDNGDEMTMNVSPKQQLNQKLMAPPAVINENPNATSTPGKFIRLFNMQTPEPRGSNEIIRPLSISGRRSIRPMTDWTPSRFENNPQFRGSYRRIKTDLDNSMDTNSSLNVTVGSEPADNNSSWFSFRSRKRERTPTNIESVKEGMLSPPKRARFGGIFSAMASPLTALRTRFSKTTINNNVVEKLSPEKVQDDDDDIDIDIPLEDSVQEAYNVENISPEVEDNEAKNKTNSPQKEENVAKEEKLSTASNEKLSDLVEEDDIAITETPLNKQELLNNVAPKRSCNIM